MRISFIPNFFKRKGIILYMPFTLLLVSIIASCTPSLDMINALEDKDEKATIIAKNSEIIYTESGRIKLKIFAPVTKIYQNTEDPYNEFPDGITVYTYSDSMEIESELTSKYAIYSDYKQLWTASNNVIAKNSKGETLNTELLYWDQKKKIIFSNEMVKITTPDGIQYGQGFISDESFNSWEIKKPTSYYYLEENKDSIK
ncbi:MAG: LPS export ABC transporter periplasmic protein LptC [Bacteroidales bacterium]|nr:MAG: LPS export ABC transporter periplasmic protein LptC [Bacteroidales bacterium]